MDKAGAGSADGQRMRDGAGTDSARGCRHRDVSEFKAMPTLPVWGACCHSSGYSDQPGQLDEIVGSHCQRELEVQLLHATQHWPRQSANGLAPPEWLLDPFALLLADLVSAVADSATVG